MNERRDVPRSRTRLLIALGLHVLILVLVVAQPLWVMATGDVVWLETQKMDPRSLFRGDYVILGYGLAQQIVPADMADRALETGSPVYVTVTDERPARFVDVGLARPALAPDQRCIVGRVRAAPAGGRASVDFPQIAQFFVPEGTGRAIEEQRGEDLLARAAVSAGCNAVLLGLEPR